MLTGQDISEPANIVRTGSRQVVFACAEPNARMAKISTALRARGWEVTVLYLSAPSIQLKDFYDRSIACTSPAHLIWMATKLEPLVYHVFDSWHLQIAEKFLDIRPGKIILDIYDVMTGTVHEHIWSKRDMFLEQACLKGFDGICARSLTAQIPKKAGFPLAKRVLFFPEYCKADTPELLPKRTDGLHLVYVGTVPEKYTYDRRGCGCCDIDFVRSIAARGIHYHLYPAINENFERRFAPYLELADINPYFHFHRPLRHDEMLREISQYHLGVMVVSEETLRTGDWNFNELTHRYFIPNKVFDYLDANLGLLLNGGKTVNWLMGRTGTALVMTREQILEDTKDSLRRFAADKGLAGKIAAARERLAVTKQAERLERFYHAVAEG